MLNKSESQTLESQKKELGFSYDELKEIIEETKKSKY
jgi:hypothetical protein